MWHSCSRSTAGGGTLRIPRPRTEKSNEGSVPDVEPWEESEEYGRGIARELSEYLSTHPGITVTGPRETMSHLWEVTFPRAATMAFDDPGLMLWALRLTKIPKE
jgi:hypothetical protein